MKRVFVVDARVPRGGTHMAYHIGRLIHRLKGYEFVNVVITNVRNNIFAYDVPMTTISQQEMENSITDQDILICNPSAASVAQFGLRLPGKKIMYIQDFRTYSYLDCHFDIYACVSTLVQDFLKATYRLEVPVISPFIDVSDAGKLLPWQERAPHTALVYLKSATREHMHVYHCLKEKLATFYPQLQLVEFLSDYNLSHADLMERIASVRYLLNICIAEGFGLVPLEALALGTVPFGLDGLAGREYLRYGDNSFCLSFKDMKDEQLKKMVHDMQQFKGLSIAESERAQSYSQDVFYKRWTQLLESQI